MIRQLTFWTVLLGLIGLLLWALLCWKRRSLQQAATTGPAWKQRLLRATLMLVTLAGTTAPLAACCYAWNPPPPEATVNSKSAVDLFERHYDELLLLEAAASDGTLTQDVIDTRSRMLDREFRWLSQNERLTDFQRDSAEQLRQRTLDLMSESQREDILAEQARIADH